MECMFPTPGLIMARIQYMIFLSAFCYIFYGSYFTGIHNVDSAKVDLPHLHDKNFSAFCDPRYYRFPSCVDSHNGYLCNCGPGFQYNSNGMCISVSTNSRLEFGSGTKSQYATIVGKPLRAMDAFTVTFWLRVKKRLSSGYIVSYSVREHPNIFYMMLENGVFKVKIYNETIEAAPPLEKDNVWKHIAFSWDSIGGKWSLHQDGVRVNSFSHFGSGLLLPSSGETTLGAPSQHFARDIATGFGSQQTTPSLHMDISHFNVWFNSYGSREIRDFMKDCHLKYCGTAVRWTDFRDGTRGNVKLRWPSGLFSNDNCFGEWTDPEQTCDRFCSLFSGARCREEMIENVHWNRSAVSLEANVTCPGTEESENRTAHRACKITATQPTGSKGKWDSPDISECLSPETKRLLKLSEDLAEEKKSNYDEVFPILRRLVEATKFDTRQTPNDVSAYVQTLENTLKFEDDRIKNRNWLAARSTNDQTTHQPTTKLYPNSSDVKLFMTQFVTIFDNLLPTERNTMNEHAWNLTKPFGQSLVHLLSIMQEFVDIHAGVLLRDVVVARSSPLAANFSMVKTKMAINMEVHFTNLTTTLRYPRDDQMSMPIFKNASETRAIIKKSVWLGNSSLASKRAFVVTTVFIANVSEFLPNPLMEKTSPREDKLNSGLYLIRFFPEDPTPLKPRYIVTTFSYLEPSNISDTQCFRLIWNADKFRKNAGAQKFNWKFNKAECSRVHTTTSRAFCTCNDSGFFYGVTTDMFNLQWEEEKNIVYFMNWATYFGCAMSALCSLLGFCILVFLRTTSNTSTLHKNTALAVGFAQLSLMCGIDLHEFPIPCRVFTIATLYFILCIYCWMMNQAFHIYSVVTYSVHNNDEVEDGSVAKFMVIGWFLPILPVLIGAVTKGDKFFQKGACFVAWEWFLIVGGPGVGIIFVTLLMKVIALKEYMQSSYSLSEKGNKLVVNYMKAGRSQWGTVLAMYGCLLVALYMRSTVLKFLFAIFSILQGSSLLCFSVLMNDEVRNILQNTYEGNKDKEQMDIMEELAELTHTQEALAAHRLSKRAEGSFQRSGDQEEHDSLSPTTSSQDPPVLDPVHKHGLLHQIWDVLGKGEHALAAGGEGGFNSGGPRDVQDEHGLGFLDDSAMMDTHV